MLTSQLTLVEHRCYRQLVISEITLIVIDLSTLLEDIKSGLIWLFEFHEFNPCAVSKTQPRLASGEDWLVMLANHISKLERKKIVFMCNISFKIYQSVSG